MEVRALNMWRQEHCFLAMFLRYCQEHRDMWLHRPALSHRDILFDILACHEANASRRAAADSDSSVELIGESHVSQPPRPDKDQLVTSAPVPSLSPAVEETPPVPSLPPAAEETTPVPSLPPAAEETTPVPSLPPAAEETMPVPSLLPAPVETTPVPSLTPTAAEKMVAEVRAVLERQFRASQVTPEAARVFGEHLDAVLEEVVSQGGRESTPEVEVSQSPSPSPQVGAVFSQLRLPVQEDPDVLLVSRDMFGPNFREGAAVHMPVAVLKPEPAEETSDDVHHSSLVLFQSPLPVKRKYRVRQQSFRCRVCATSFCSLQNRQRHEAGHTNDGDVACSLCLNRFRSHDDLQRHRAHHKRDKVGKTTRKAFCCRVCFRLFVSLRRKMEHDRVRDQASNTNRCETCGEGFCDRTSLSAHCTSAHPS